MDSELGNWCWLVDADNEVHLVVCVCSYHLISVIFKTIFNSFSFLYPKPRLSEQCRNVKKSLNNFKKLCTFELLKIFSCKKPGSNIRLRLLFVLIFAFISFYRFIIRWLKNFHSFIQPFISCWKFIKLIYFYFFRNSKDKFIKDIFESFRFLGFR